MKYSSYIDNVRSLDWGLTIQQAYIFSWLWDIPSWADTAIFDNDVWYFASKTKALDELPLLTTKIDTVYRHYKSLKDKGLIDIKKVDGKDYIKFTEKSKDWGRKSEHSENNPNTLGNISDNHSDLIPTYKTTILNNNTNDKLERETKRFQPPTIQQIDDYIFEKTGHTDLDEAENFFNYYESKGWIVGRTKMKKWKNSLAGWLKRRDTYNKQTPKRKVNDGSDLFDLANG